MQRYLVLLLLGLAWMGAAQAERIEAAVEQYKPFAIPGQNGALTGIAIDIANEIGKRTGNVFTVTAYPLARLRKKLAEQTVLVALAESPLWFNSASHENYVFSTPYVHVYEYVYYPVGKTLNASKPMDLAGCTIGINHGYYYAAFDALFQKNIVKHEDAFSSESLLRKLLAGRTDAIFLDNFEFGYSIKQGKMQASDFARGMQLTNSPVGFMIRNDRSALLQKVNQAIAQLQADGTITKIVNRYIGAER